MPARSTRPATPQVEPLAQFAVPEPDSAPAPLLDATAPVTSDLDRVGDIIVEVRVEMGRTTRRIRELRHDLVPGKPIALDKLEGEKADVYVNDLLFARGKVIVLEDNYAVEIEEIVTDRRTEAARP